MWQQWLRRPQNVWLRRTLFQIHLWTGIGLGLYVVAISITGSAIVFRNEMYTWASQRPTVTPGEQKLGAQEFRSKVTGAYPGYTTTVTDFGATPQWKPNDRLTVRAIFDLQEVSKAHGF